MSVPPTNPSPSPAPVEGNAVRLLKSVALAAFLVIMIGFAMITVFFGSSAAPEVALRLERTLVVMVALVPMAYLLVTLSNKLVESLERDGAPRFERNWGAIGNGAQGWRLSASLTYLLLVALSAGLFVLLVSLAVSLPGPETKPTTNPAKVAVIRLHDGALWQADVMIQTGRA